jgi:hypothetical protein
MRQNLASLQETTLELVWIRDGVVCLGSRPADYCYRAVLAVQGPPEAFAQAPDRLQPVLDGFAGFLNALAQPGMAPPTTLQALVLAEPTDLADYAARLEQRAAVLPAHLAREALADAAWARQHGPELGLLDRRGYLVVPAESLSSATAFGSRVLTGPRFGRWLGGSPALDEPGARAALDLRCAELTERLVRAGVWARRLDDAALTDLFHACWSRRRDARFERDLRSVLGAVEDGS